MSDLFSAIVTLYLALSGLAEATPIRVTLTGYTCEAHPQNAMYPCNVTRWGATPTSAGLACPPEWRGRELFFGGQWLRCDDTPYHSIIYGLPHVDARVATYQEAMQIGVQEATLYEQKPMNRKVATEIVIVLGQVHYGTNSDTLYCYGCGIAQRGTLDDADIALFFNRHRFCSGTTHHHEEEPNHERERR